MTSLYDKTRAHEIGLGENEGDVIDYSETSFEDMSLPSVGNVNMILNRSLNTATNEKNKINLSKPTSEPKTFESGNQNTRIIINGTYNGKNGF